MKGMFNFGLLGIRRVFGGVMPPKPSIDKWVKEHMVFWYDMSKPVDTYSQNFNDWRPHPSVNADIIITSTSFVITRFATLNDTVKCYIPDQTKNFPGMKVEVKGIVDGQELYWGYSADVKLVNITSDGTYDIPPLGTVKGNLSFRNGNIAGACNITITQLPSGQSVPTNEILKANPYLQDFSGNNRPLKLNNFLFAAMSGVGGYDISSTNILPDRANVTVTDNRIIHITKKLSTTDNMVNIVPANSNPTHKFKVTGLSDGRQVSLVNRNGGFYTFDNGEHEVTLTYPEGTTSLYNAIGVTGDIGDMDVTIEFLPKYPNALVTDGADDYGVVENLQQGVKVLFYTCNPFSLNKMFYDQRKTTSATEAFFSIYNSSSKIAYNDRNTGGVTYIDGIINNLLLASNLLNVKHTITIVNDGATESNTISPIYFSKNQRDSYFANLAFYNSIGFDSVPTKETDGFTEQDLITWVIDNMINGTPSKRGVSLCFSSKSKLTWNLQLYRKVIWVKYFLPKK
jgi:hypothetical protein